MALKSKMEVLAAHTDSVIGNAYQAFTRLLNIHEYLGRFGVDGVLYQFLDNGRRALHHLSGGDFIDKTVGKYVY